MHTTKAKQPLAHTVCAEAGPGMAPKTKLPCTKLVQAKTRRRLCIHARSCSRLHSPSVDQRMQAQSHNTICTELHVTKKSKVERKRKECMVESEYFFDHIKILLVYYVTYYLYIYIYIWYLLYIVHIVRVHLRFFPHRRIGQDVL